MRVLGGVSGGGGCAHLKASPSEQLPHDDFGLVSLSTPCFPPPASAKCVQLEIMVAKWILGAKLLGRKSRESPALEKMANASSSSCPSYIFCAIPTDCGTQHMWCLRW